MVFRLFVFSAEREQAAPPHSYAPYGLELAGTARGDMPDLAACMFELRDSEFRSSDCPTAPCAFSAVIYRLQRFLFLKGGMQLLKGAVEPLQCEMPPK